TVLTSTPTVTPTRTFTPTPTNTPNCTPAGYSFAASTGAIDPGTTLLAGSNGDDLLAAVALPFPFTLYGTSYTSAQAGTNGGLFFGTASSTFNITCLPNSIGTNLIAPYWVDLNTTVGLTACASFTGGCGIFTSATGVSPNRIFNIEWHAAYFTTNTTGADFEVRLYET